MRLPTPISISDLRGIIQTDFTVKGDPGNVIRGINEIHSVEEGDLSFVDNEKYYDRMLRSKATVILINKDTECPAGKTLLVTDDPLQAYLCDAFTVPANLAGLCGVSIPCGRTTDLGLPVGLQILCPPFEEPRLLRTARAMEGLLS